MAPDAEDLSFRAYNNEQDVNAVLGAVDEAGLVCRALADSGRPRVEEPYV